MANDKKLTTGETSLDDDLNLPSFDFDAGQVEDDRSPQGKLADAIKEGAKNTFTNPATYARLMKKALPKEYGDAADSAVELADGAADLVNKSVKEIKPVAGQLAAATEKLIPERFKGIKKALNKVNDWSKGEWRDQGQDLGKQKEAALQLQLDQIFAQQEVKTAEDNAEKKIQKGTDIIRHRDQISILTTIANTLHRIDAYQSKVNQAFQKKSLELQFRSYGVQTEMLEQLKRDSETTRLRLDAVVKNTGLPDFVKLKTTEAAKEIIRNKFIGGLHNRAGNLLNRGDFTKNLLKNIKQQVNDTVGAIANAGQAMAMPLEFANLGADLGTERKKTLPELVASMATEGVLNSKLGKGADALGRRLMDSKYGSSIRKGASTINKMQNSAWQEARISEFARENDDDVDGIEDEGLKGFFKRLLGRGKNLTRKVLSDAMPSTAIATKMETDSIAKARAPAVYSNQAQKSITEVIPGYLARILREIYILRTGDTNAALQEYDYAKNKFATSQEKVKDLNASLVSKKDTDELARKSLKGLQDLGANEDLSEEEQRVLAEFLIRRNVHGGKTVEADKMVNPETFFGPLAGKHADKFANFFKKTFEVGEDGKMGSDTAYAKQAAMSKWFHSLGDNFKGIQGKLQEHLNVGDYDAVRSTGVMNDKGDEMDVDKLLDAMVSSLRTADSDVNIKENIKSLGNMKALESIKAIGTSVWNYKPGSKAANGEKPQIGPMAQDVNKVMGNSFAPGGKKIDLVNMNGLNMSGIIDIDKKLDGTAKIFAGLMDGIVKTQDKLMEAFKDGYSNVSQRFSGLGTTADSKETDQQKMLRYVERIAKNTEESLVLQAIGQHGINKGEKIEDIFNRLRRGDMSLPANASVARRLRSIGMNLSSLGFDAGQKALEYGDKAHDYIEGRINLLGKHVEKGWNKLTGGRSMKEIATQGKISIQHAKDDLFEKFDMYVEGEVKPRLQAIKLQAGDYRSKVSGKVIKKLQDIDGDIIDENGNVVLTVAQLKSTYYKTGVAGKVVRAGAWFKETLSKLRNWGEEAASNIYQSGITNLRRAWTAIQDLADYPRDVFVRGELRPRLLGVVMSNGGYLSQTTGKVIRRPGDIDGPITDHQGQVLITTNEISEKGLVDLSGATIQTGAVRVAGMAVKGVTGAFAFGKAIMQKGRDFLSNVKNEGMANLGRFFDKLTDGLGFGGKQGIDLLTQIRDLLDERLGRGNGKPSVFGDKDGDGVRDNSYQDKQNKLKAENSDGNNNNNGVTERKNANTPRIYQNKNTIDAIIDGVAGLKDKAMGWLGGAAEAAGGFMGGAAGGAAAGGAAGGKPRGRLGRAWDAVRGVGGKAAAGMAGGGAVAGAGKMAAAKGIAGAFLKKLPGIGLGVGAIDAIRRIMGGDYMGAAMTLGAGGAAMLPGPGTAASVGLDAALMARDSGMMGGHAPSVSMGGAGTPTTVAPTPSALGTAAGVAGDVAGAAVGGAAMGKAGDVATKGGRLAGATKGWGGLKYIGKAAALPFKGAWGAAKLGAKGVGALASGAGALAGAARGAGSAAAGPIAKYGGAAARGVGTGIRAVGTPLVNAAGTAASLGGKGLMMAGRGAMMGTGALASGAMSAVKFGATRIAAPLLMNVAMPLLGAIFSPAGVAIMGAAALGYGAYKLYKWASRKEFKDIERLRFIQYGLNNGDDELMRKVYELEQMFEPMVSIDADGMATIKEKDFDKEKFLSIFGIEENDTEKASDAAEWLQYRFKPVFLTHVGAMKSVTGNAKLDPMGKLSKADKLKLLPMVSMPNGPYGISNSPFPELKQMMTDPTMVEEAVRWCRKEIEKLKDDHLTPAEKAADKVANKNFPGSDAGGAAAAGKDGVQTPETKKAQEKKSFFEDVAQKFTTLTGINLSNDETRTTKTAIAKVSVESQEIFDIRVDSLTALSAVRYKTYGLKRQTYNEVVSLSYLEEATLKEMRFMGNKKVMWTGDLAEVAKKAARFFEFTSSDANRLMRWNQWFMGRFLPVYTTYLAEIYQATGKSDKSSAELVMDARKSLTVANALVAMSSCWRVADMPWRDAEPNMDPASCEENLEFLKKQVKEMEVAQEKASKGGDTPSPTAGAPEKFTDKTAANDEPAQPKETHEQRRARLMANSPMPETGGALSTSGLTQDMPGGAAPRDEAQLRKERDARMSGVPIAASGPMASGDGASKYLELRNYQGGKANIEGLNPSMKKNLLAMIQEYGEKTGRKTGINRGFVTKEQQEIEHKKNPKLAAKPGGSLHEKGLAVDIDRVTLNEMDSMGLLRKYGFTRPIGGEPWHLEPAGIQKDRAAVRKDPSLATKMIDDGVGKGGGGFGTVEGAAQGQTNPEMAARIADAKGKETPTGIPASSPASDANRPENGGALPGVAAAANDASMGNTPSKSSVKPGGGMNDIRAPQAGATGYKAMEPTIADAAQLTGVDKTKLAALMGIESSFNPNAKGTGGNAAQGLGQFKPGTWNDMVKKYGAKYGIDANTPMTDPRANAIMTGLLYKENQNAVGKVKANPTEGDVYSAHLMGQGGARTFHKMKDSDYPADVMQKAAADNKQLYYKNGDVNQPRTKAEMLAMFDKKLSKAKTDFGIETNIPVEQTQTAANDAPGIIRTNAVVPKREIARPETPPPIIAPRINPIIPETRHQAQSKDVPQADQDRIRMVSKLESVESILKDSYNIQAQMLDALNAMVEILPKVGAANQQSAVQPAIEKKDPATTSYVPDRSARKVGEPVVPLRHKLQL